MSRIQSWGKRPFVFVLWGSGLFVALTLAGMLIYPGGTHTDPANPGYAFFQNFFSDLGRFEAHNGTPNWFSAPLFFVALSFAGLGLVFFFIVSPQFFGESRLQRVLSVSGSLFGVISGFAYVGIAFAPADVSPGAHFRFVMLAFRSFLPAVIFYFVVILANRDYPNRYAVVYAVFSILLAAYILLITRGPGFDTAEGILIQATGQKIIVYAAIITVFVQSWGAKKLAGAGQPVSR
ncbi:MAG TPA: hypothetical protein DEH22_07450 [Chloroflexi bacterium]|nr:hypothetical protein [Chloroflexota bacterium]